MTPIFLKYHYFRFQKKSLLHKYSVSSAIQWLIKNKLTMHDTPSLNLKKTRYRRIIHQQNKILSAHKLKCLLKIYLKKHDNEQLVFGNIINLSNRMYKFIYIITGLFIHLLDPSLPISKQLLQGHWWNISFILKKFVSSLIQEGYMFKTNTNLVLPFKIWLDGCSIKNHQILKV